MNDSLLVAFLKAEICTRLTFLIDDGDVGDRLDLHGTLGPRQWILKALKEVINSMKNTFSV